MPATVRLRRLLVVGLLLASPALAACGSDGDDAIDGDDANQEATTTAPADASTSTAPPTTAEATTSTTDGSESAEGFDTETSVLDSLPDGEHYGYMAGLESGEVEGQPVQVVIFDEVEFLTGVEAAAAAREDGVIPPDQESIENDYYIRNNDQTVRRLAVVPEASVTSLRDGSPDPVPSSVDEVWRQDHLFRIVVGNVRGVTTVSGIEAVYLP